MPLTIDVTVTGPENNPTPVPVRLEWADTGGLTHIAPLQQAGTSHPYSFLVWNDGSEDVEVDVVWSSGPEEEVRLALDWTKALVIAGQSLPNSFMVDIFNGRAIGSHIGAQINGTKPA